MNYSIDACALIALLDNEEGANIVQSIISKAIDGEISVYMSIINYTEVYYDRLKIGGLEKAQIFAENLSYLPITIVENISRDVSHNAARIKIVHHLSLADAIGLATAAELSACFVTSDHKEMEPVEASEPIPFVWLPARPKK
jgi:predicted nucleic acid-binding protein